MLSRRRLLTLGAAAGATGLLAAAVPQSSVAARSGASAAFTVPLPVPPVLEPALRTATHDIYRMTLKEADARILPGVTTRVRSFDGQFPGPTIRARRGRPVVVQQVNELGTPVAVHLHGGHVPQASDGHPMDLIKPGGSRTYHYPNDQSAATLWYHDHAHMLESENVYRGLSGLYVLTDELEDLLPLPKGRYDVPLLLRDAKLAGDGALAYDVHDIAARGTTMVNGVSRPYLNVAARKYRFRLVNVSNDRVFAFRLSDGSRFTQIASDGGLLPAPVPMDSIGLWPAERAEIVVDFSSYAPGTQLVLENLAPYPGEDAQIMRFDVGGKVPDPSRVPEQLRPLPQPGKPTVERTFEMTTDMAHDRYLINGKEFDMDRVDIRPRLGVDEAWTVSVPAGNYAMPHTFHTHLAQFRVLERNGKPPAPEESGLKDTVPLVPGETVRLHVRFTTYTGRYIYHCHMMGHSALGMMGQMEITA
ncbi:multicopper oxidase domain-containing protein [Streptomyces nondiastaticus]|uniref:multicopper oxidase family protein n=1 Tax=Streptomyces nondiastaticus TaxID=3154512 RepID=UPI0034259C90